MCLGTNCLRGRAVDTLGRGSGAEGGIAHACLGRWNSYRVGGTSPPMSRNKRDRSVDSSRAVELNGISHVHQAHEVSRYLSVALYQLRM